MSLHHFDLLSWSLGLLYFEVHRLRFKVLLKQLLTGRRNRNLLDKDSAHGFFEVLLDLHVVLLNLHLLLHLLLHLRLRLPARVEEELPHQRQVHELREQEQPDHDVGQQAVQGREHVGLRDSAAVVAVDSQAEQHDRLVGDSPAVVVGVGVGLLDGDQDDEGDWERGGDEGNEVHSTRGDQHGGLEDSGEQQDDIVVLAVGVILEGGLVLTEVARTHLQQGRHCRRYDEEDARLGEADREQAAGRHVHHHDEGADRGVVGQEHGGRELIVAEGSQGPVSQFLALGLQALREGEQDTADEQRQEEQRHGVVEAGEKLGAVLKRVDTVGDANQPRRGPLVESGDVAHSGQRRQQRMEVGHRHQSNKGDLHHARHLYAYEPAEEESQEDAEEPEVHYGGGEDAHGLHLAIECGVVDVGLEVVVGVDHEVDPRDRGQGELGAEALRVQYELNRLALQGSLVAHVDAQQSVPQVCRRNSAVGKRARQDGAKVEAVERGEGRLYPEEEGDGVRRETLGCAQEGQRERQVKGAVGRARGGNVAGVVGPAWRGAGRSTAGTGDALSALDLVQVLAGGACEGISAAEAAGRAGDAHQSPRIHILRRQTGAEAVDDAVGGMTGRAVGGVGAAGAARIAGQAGGSRVVLPQRTRTRGACCGQIRSTGRTVIGGSGTVEAGRGTRTADGDPGVEQTCVADA